MATRTITYLLEAPDQLDELSFDLQAQITIGRHMPHKKVAALDDILVGELSSALELAEERERLSFGSVAFRGISCQRHPGMRSGSILAGSSSCPLRFIAAFVVRSSTAMMYHVGNIYT
jgi:hypothetical protein